MGAIFDGPDLDRLRLKGKFVPRVPVMASGRGTLSDSETVCRVVFQTIIRPAKVKAGHCFGYTTAHSARDDLHASIDILKLSDAILRMQVGGLERGLFAIERKKTKPIMKHLQS